MRALSNRTLALALIAGWIFTTVGAAGGQVVAPPRPEPPEALGDGVYLVTFEPGTPPNERAAAVSRSGASIRRNFNSIDVISVFVPNEAALARLRAEGRILAVVESRPISLAVAPGAVQRNGKGGGGGSGGGGGGKKPKPPAGLMAAAVSTSEIVLGWSDMSNDEAGFAIERCTGALCGDFAEIVRTGPDATGYTDAGLTAGTLYRYRVTAFNASGTSRPSETAEATTDVGGPIEEPPAAPGDLTASAFALAVYQVDIEWSDNSGNEDGFRVERCDTAAAGCLDADFVELVETGPNLTAHTDLLVEPNRTYTYRVLAFNGFGPSAYSNLSEVTVPFEGGGQQVVPFGVSRIGAAPGNLSVTGAGVGVAIVDTGLDFSHPDLDLAPELPGVNAFNAFGGSCQDFYGHGTHVGGTVAARDNDIDVVGVAPDATLYCVNVFTNDPVEGVIATDESLVAGLDWIAGNASVLDPPIRVVNMSLGRERTPDDDNPLHALRSAVANLHAMGIAVAVAAGNDPLKEVFAEVPASYPEVLAVASSTAVAGVNGYDDFFTPCPAVSPIAQDTASYFTTDGQFTGGVGVTISAPGGAQENIFWYLGTCYLDPIGILSTALGGGTERLMGTSMASPHAAGVLALMWEVEQNLGAVLDPETARARIRNTADRRGTAPFDSPLVEYTFDGEREGILWAPAAVGDAAPPPVDYAPDVSVSAPGDGDAFASGEVISFEGAASDIEDGDLTSALVWTSTIDGQIGTGGAFLATLSDGIHVVTASAEDSALNVATDSVSITVGSAENPSVVSISSVTYAEVGRSLIATIRLSDEFGNPVPGAQVTAELIEFFYTLADWDYVGTTDASGRVDFQLDDAPIGCYVTNVLEITAPGFTWNGFVPSDFYCM